MQRFVWRWFEIKIHLNFIRIPFINVNSEIHKILIAAEEARRTFNPLVLTPSCHQFYCVWCASILTMLWTFHYIIKASITLRKIVLLIPWVIIEALKSILQVLRSFQFVSVVVIYLSPNRSSRISQLAVSIVGVQFPAHDSFPENRKNSTNFSSTRKEYWSMAQRHSTSLFFPSFLFSSSLKHFDFRFMNRVAMKN